jgi:hypothetical protein
MNTYKYSESFNKYAESKLKDEFVNGKFCGIMAISDYSIKSPGDI